MVLQAGHQVTLQVKREAPFGLFLTDGNEEILLHNKEQKETLALDQSVSVFLYTDHQGRLAATTAQPLITLDTYAWVNVVEVHHKYGVFVNVGITKDILVSRDDLPYSYDEWPKEGDTLYCKLKVDKKGRLFAHLAPFEEIDTIAKPATESDFNKNIEGVVYKLVEEGAHILTEEGFMGFNHKSEQTTPVRLGEKVSGRIIVVKEDGRVNVSLLKRSHEVMDQDAEVILTYLEGRGGSMPYWDKSPADLIEARFNMSKSAFKRAVGRLMKQGKVYQEEGWTHLKKETKAD